MNEFQQFFSNRIAPDINKWSNYFDIYEEFFSKYKNRPIRFLEIGVDRGGSSEMWKSYFGEESVIVGIDIIPECKKFENPTEKRYIEIGDQSDPEFLKYLVEKYGKFDIILDDGSHFFHHQISSFEYLWNALSATGIYMVEDAHTSYYPSHDGWCRDRNNFIEYTKLLIDEINAWHRLELLGKGGRISDLYAMHYYSGVVVFEKKNFPVPYSRRSGKESEKFSAHEETVNSVDYIANASFVKILSWRIRAIAYMLIGNKRMYSRFKNQLKAKRILKKYYPEKSKK